MNKTLGLSLGKAATATLVKVAIAGVAVMGGTALVSSSVFASLTATATNTSGGSVSTGTLSLTQAASGVAGITGGFTTAITAMGPGDTVNRYINLTNGGTLDAINPTLSIAATPSNALTTSATAGIQVFIQNCTVDWTNTGGCTGTKTTALAATAASALGTAAALTLPSTLAGAVSHLQISLSLPAGSENVLNGVLPGGTIQGLTTAITWTFNETERTGTTTNS
jgi:hypothetical protein